MPNDANEVVNAMHEFLLTAEVIEDYKWFEYAGDRLGTTFVQALRDYSRYVDEIILDILMRN